MLEQKAASKSTGVEGKLHDIAIILLGCSTAGLQRSPAHQHDPSAGSPQSHAASSPEPVPLPAWS